jgi:hypothetical protein
VTEEKWIEVREERMERGYKSEIAQNFRNTKIPFNLFFSF